MKKVMSGHAVSWFELPAVDLERARRFYGTLLGKELRRETFAGMEMAIFPYAQDAGVGGALVQHERFTPSTDGALVYLDTQGELDAWLAKVGPAGGQVLQPKTDIGDPGFIAVIRDCEGNKVGLHAYRA